jgi:hypothetical protein
MRFRFTIRDLLWLTVVVALAVGWWVDHRQTLSKLDADETKIQKLITDFNSLVKDYAVARERLSVLISPTSSATMGTSGPPPLILQNVPPAK